MKYGNQKFGPNEISMRGGSGLGDAIYLQSVARYYADAGKDVEACSNWSDVFLPLQGRIKVSVFRKERINCVVHYSNRRGVAGTDQFQDCCLNAGITEPVELRLDWKIRGRGPHVTRVCRDGRPIILVQLPRVPMGRRDGLGSELLPNCQTIQRAIDQLKGRVLLVQIGRGVPLYKFKGIDIDLANHTSVAGMIDVASVAHGMLGYCSFVVPLAESLNKPALLVWSRRGLNARHAFVRQITPAKILHRASSRAIFDDCSDEELTGAVDGFFEQATTAGSLPGPDGCDRRQWAGVAAE